VGAELVVAALAVSVAATMVTIQPAAARQPELTVTPATPAHFFATIGPVRAHLSVSLPTPGEQVYRALLADAATGAPRDDVQKVFVELVPPAGSGLTPERVELTSEPDPLGGLYGARGTFTPLEGDWSIDLIVRRAGELDESASFVMPVASAPAPEAGPPPDTGIGVPAPLAAAWSLLPPGAAGWLPALLALSAVAFLGRLPRSSLVSAARGAAVAVAIVGIGATGTRELVASANEPASKALAEQAVDSGGGDAQLGEALYRANCASCHGIDADGHGAVPTLPDAGPLREAVAEQSDAELSYRIAYGVAGTPMPPFAGLLTAEDRANLIAYLRRDTRDD
jgi:mono/diheme cytochrome c family protein